jgi:hypothetical protein
VTEQDAPDSSSLREDLVEHLRDQLFGPTSGEEEELLKTDPPHKRYILGVLYPRESGGGGNGGLEDDEDIGVAVGDGDEPDDSPLAAMLQRAPASAGITFAVDAGSSVRIEISAARYDLRKVDTTKSGKAVERFVRIPMPLETVLHPDSGESAEQNIIFGGRGEFRLRWRAIDGLRVATVSIVNTSVMKTDSPISSSDCLFQLRMRITCEEGRFVEPPHPSVALDAEEEELRLRYRKRRAWAVGHATSVSWSAETPTSIPKSIEMDFMPLADVFDFNSERHEEATFDPDVLSPRFLSETDDVDSLKAALDSFRLTDNAPRGDFLKKVRSED